MIVKVFTYSQYIKCIHTLRLNAILQLAEEEEDYKLERMEEKYHPNELIKNVLQNKKEAMKFINQFVEPRKKVKEEDLIIYSNKNMIKKCKTKEADLVYKINNQEIFFLIEYQSEMDSNLSYRLLNYCLDIMKNWVKNKKMRKTSRISNYSSSCYLYR